MKFKKHKINNYNILPIYMVKNFLHENLNFKIKSYDVYFRHTGGWGNGYVGIPFWHPFYKKDYNELNNKINIHGGLTFSDYDDEEDIWIIGFDTNHSGDDLYKWEYNKVLEETLRLREQCLKVKEAQRILKLNKIIKL